MQEENNSNSQPNDEDLDLFDKVKIEQDRLKAHPDETDLMRDYRVRMMREKFWKVVDG